MCGSWLIARYAPRKRSGLSLVTDPPKPRATARWRGSRKHSSPSLLGRLRRSNHLVRRGSGVFTAPRTGRPAFRLSSLLRRADTAIRAEAPATPVVGWSPEWVAPYALNVPGRHWTVLETPHVRP